MLLKSENRLVQEVVSKMNTIYDLNAASSLMHWDTETYIPSAAENIRTEQISTIDLISHNLLTDKKSKELVDKIHSKSYQLSATEEKLLEIFTKDHKKAIRYPSEFVSKITKAQGKALSSWKKARKENNFSYFENSIEELTELRKEQLNYMDEKEHPYESFLNEYEENISVQQLDNLFDEILIKSKELNDKYQDCYIEESIFKSKYNKDLQLELSKAVAGDLNFSFYSGRLDESTHPFTTNFDIRDVRITTRFNEKNPFTSFYSTIHETGHGLYEQNICTSLTRTFAAEGTSLGVHESQSLFWENCIGRSYGFWKFYSDRFNDILKSGFSPESLFIESNKLKNTAIRTESDELNYNLHIKIRYEIEKGLITESIKPSHIPEVWNSLYKEYLNIDVKDFNTGCLQDIHWAFGEFGYFPTYTLGKIYSASILDSIELNINDIDGNSLKNTLNILKENVYQYGRLKTNFEIMENFNENFLSFSPFENYIEKKYNTLMELL